VSQINQLCLRLKQLNSEVNAEEKLFVMLEGLPESYESLRQSLEINNISFDAACQHVRDYQEKRVQQIERVYEARMYYAKQNGKHKDRRMYKTGGESSKHSDTHKSKSDKKDNRCWTCGERGHTRIDCPLNKNAPRCKLCRGIGHIEAACRRNASSDDESSSDEDEGHAAHVTFSESDGNGSDSADEWAA